MKKVLSLLKILIPALILVFILYLLLLSDPLLSEDQENTIELFGYPSQFTITYLPKGEADKPQLVRSEVWYYNEQKIEISFLGGNFVSESEYIPEAETSNTILHPEDFDYFTNYSDMESMFGVENIQPVDFLPIFYEENQIATYITGTALFIIENDSLTYFQTLGSSSEDFLEIDSGQDDMQESQVSILQDTSVIDNDTNTDMSTWKTFQNTYLGIKMKYPFEWYLADEDIVLTTYDTGYMEKGLDLPEKRLKCDFNTFDPDMTGISYEETILIGGVTVLKGLAVDNSGEDGPGMGDGVMFLFQKENKDTVALICFSYSEEFQDTLFEAFETFEFIDKQ